MISVLLEAINSIPRDKGNMKALTVPANTNNFVGFPTTKNIISATSKNPIHHLLAFTLKVSLISVRKDMEV